MTELLKKAIAKAGQLPDSDQDSLARIILDELEGDARWDQLFVQTREKLAKLAARAWAEFESGRAQPHEPDSAETA